jgi:hypothetical protein
MVRLIALVDRRRSLAGLSGDDRHILALETPARQCPNLSRDACALHPRLPRRVHLALRPTVCGYAHARAPCNACLTMADVYTAIHPNALHPHWWHVLACAIMRDDPDTFIAADLTIGTVTAWTQTVHNALAMAVLMDARPDPSPLDGPLFTDDDRDDVPSSIRTGDIDKRWNAAEQ